MAMQQCYHTNFIICGYFTWRVKGRAFMVVILNLIILPQPHKVDSFPTLNLGLFIVNVNFQTASNFD